MEPGNLYFVVEKSNYMYRNTLHTIPIMVSATNELEAIKRVEQAHKKALENTIARNGEPHLYALVEGGKCSGPTWGAVVEAGTKAGTKWGAACAPTPALAIQAAFDACKKKDQQSCDGMVIGVRLALSGSTSWSGQMCPGGCMPSEDNSFATFNAFTDNLALSDHYIEVY
jgi:hypothetical protein